MYSNSAWGGHVQSYEQHKGFALGGGMCVTTGAMVLEHCTISVNVANDNYSTVASGLLRAITSLTLV